MDNVTLTIRTHAKIYADACEMYDATNDLSALTRQLDQVAVKGDTPLSRKFQIAKELRERAERTTIEIGQMFNDDTFYAILDLGLTLLNKRAIERATIAKHRREVRERTMRLREQYALKTAA